MNITVHSGPRQLRLGAGVEVNITLTLVDSTREQPYANTLVKVHLGAHFSKDVKTDPDGVLTVAFSQIGSKDKMNDALSVEVGVHPSQPVAYSFYPNALITQKVLVPPKVVIAPPEPKLLDAYFVAENGTRTVSLNPPDVSGALTVTKVSGESGILVHTQLPAQLSTQNKPKLTFRGSAFGDVLKLQVKHVETDTTFPLVIHVVRDASEDVAARRVELLKTSSNKRENQTTLKHLKAATKEANPIQHAGNTEEDNWQTEQAISLDAFIQRHRAHRIFLIGENHKHPEDLETVWAILDKLHDPPNHHVRLLFEQIPFHDLRLTVNERSGLMDFQTGLKALNEGLITPELFNEWTNWSTYWENAEENSKILTLLQRAVRKGMIVSGLDLQKDGALKIGDLARDTFMRARLLELYKDTIDKNTKEVLVTINGLAHLLGHGGKSLLGIGRLLRGVAQGPEVVTLRPVNGVSPVTFKKRQGTNDYQFTVANYQG